MLWLALMSVVRNKHLPVLESRRYAVRQVYVHVIRIMNYTTASFFSFFFYRFRFWKDPQMDIFLQILDKNWLDDT